MLVSRFDALSSFKPAFWGGGSSIFCASDSGASYSTCEAASSSAVGTYSCIFGQSTRKGGEAWSWFAIGVLTYRKHQVHEMSIHYRQLRARWTYCMATGAHPMTKSSQHQPYAMRFLVTATIRPRFPIQHRPPIESGSKTKNPKGKTCSFGDGQPSLLLNTAGRQTPRSHRAFGGQRACRGRKRVALVISRLLSGGCMNGNVLPSAIGSHRTDSSGYSRRPVDNGRRIHGVRGIIAHRLA